MMFYWLSHPCIVWPFILYIGLVFGSFATMLCYRIPRGLPIIGREKKTSTVMNFSKCPSCGHRLHAKDLIPLFSWIVQHGKCRYCGAPISIKYPVTELLTVFLCGLAYAFLGLSLNGILMIILSPILASLIMIDLEFFILPDVLNLILFIGGVQFVALGGQSILMALLAAFVYAGSMLALRWIFLLITKKDGMGMGDIKFFAVAGLWLGLPLFAPFLLISSVIGIIFGLIHKWFSDEVAFPFGPALIAGYLICFYASTWILTVL